METPEEQKEHELVQQQNEFDILKEQSSQLEKVIGMCANPKEAEAFAKVVAQVMHRHNQQSLTRFFIAWMKIASENDFGTDLRNEDTKEFAQKVNKYIRDNNLNYLSYI